VATNFGVPGGALVPEMLVTGERLTDGALLPALASFARECVDADERAGWLTEIERLYRSIPADSEEGHFAIRFLGEGGSVSEFGMAGAESGEDEE
jgi:hypothetical protein